MANMEARPYVAMLGNSTLPELHRFATEGADWGFDTKLLDSGFAEVALILRMISLRQTFGELTLCDPAVVDPFCTC